MDVTAAVFRTVGTPLTIETVELDVPQGREVLVRTVATGVCHSDLHVVDGLGRFALDRPFVLGHEGAGVVEAVGAGRHHGPAGRSRRRLPLGLLRHLPAMPVGPPQSLHRRRGRTARPGRTPRLSQNGQPFQTFAGIGSFAERMLLHENSLVTIDPDLPLDRAALVGCGVLTGVGAALRSAGLQAAQTVAVFGCGGVGLSIVQGARIGGARQIIAVDMFDSKLEMAQRPRRHPRGEQHAGRSGRRRCARSPAAPGSITRSRRSATPPWCRQAIVSLAIRGTATIVGVLPPEAEISFPWMAIRPECKVQTSRMGSNQFRTDIPAYLEFYRQGRLKLDEMVTRRGRHRGHQRGVPRHEGGRGRPHRAAVRLTGGTTSC